MIMVITISILEIIFYLDIMKDLHESIDISKNLIGLSSFVIVWAIVGFYLLYNANIIC